MVWLNSVKETLADSFRTLPLLITGFTFLLGTLTSNVGILYLFIGHLILVPMLCYLATDTQEPFWGEPFNPLSLGKWILSVFSILTIQSVSVNTYGLYTMCIYFALAQVTNLYVFETDSSVLFTLNPISWFFPSEPVKPSEHCSIVPGAEDTTVSAPSAWATHITFFVGFILANAAAIYNEAIPVLTQTTDLQTVAVRQAALDSRVANRKWMAGGVFITAMVVLLILLYLRTKTGCEADFKNILLPLLFIGLTGASWFVLLHTKCGIRPSDILGIVPGMISPDLIDNPIVCVNTPT
jgi:hypothetical protein